VSLLCGVDIGTSSSKGVLVSPDGTVAATASREHKLSVPRPGWAEHDAEDWWHDFASITRELTAAAREPVAGVAVSGIGPCVLPTDGEGTPLRSAILYGIDTRATAEITDLTRRYGAAEVLRICGSPLTSQAAGPKLAWLQRHEPETWARTAKVMTASSFLVHRLTGEYVLDHHTASQYTPMYDLAGQAWNGWAAEIAPGLLLPRLAWPAEVVGQVRPAAAAATGLPAGIPVTAGTVDAWAEAVSVNVTEPGDVMVMYGTTMFLVEILAAPHSSPVLWGTTGVFPGTYCLAAGMATSGAITGWLRELTGQSYSVLSAEAADAGPGAEGLLMLPYFAGERTPLFDPDARGVVIGLTLRHERGHLYRAALEATAYGVRHNLEAMADARIEPGVAAEPGAPAAEAGGARRLVAVGGGTAGALWPRIVSSVLRQPQQLPRITIGACYGDVMLAARSLGVCADPARWNPVQRVIEPDPADAEAYEQLYRLYRDLYPATREHAHALAALQHAGARPS
jgi:xylulokinase